MDRAIAMIEDSSDAELLLDNGAAPQEAASPAEQLLTVEVSCVLHSFIVGPHVHWVSYTNPRHAGKITNSTC